MTRHVHFPTHEPRPHRFRFLGPGETITMRGHHGKNAKQQVTVQMRRSET